MDPNVLHYFQEELTKLAETLNFNIKPSQIKGGYAMPSNLGAGPITRPLPITKSLVPTNIKPTPMSNALVPSSGRALVPGSLHRYGVKAAAKSGWFKALKGIAGKALSPLMVAWQASDAAKNVLKPII